MQTNTGDRLLIEAGSGDEGFETVTLNGEILHVSSQSYTREDGSLNIIFSHDYRLLIETPLFHFELMNSDHFINIQSLRIVDWKALNNNGLQSHGILGQTWRSKPASTAMEVDPIEGYVDDYAEARNDLWGIETTYNQFRKAEAQ